VQVSNVGAGDEAGSGDFFGIEPWLIGFDLEVDVEPIRDPTRLTHGPHGRLGAEGAAPPSGPVRLTLCWW
jgi:hypothetical protein